MEGGLHDFCGGTGGRRVNRAVCISLTVPQVRAQAFQINLEDLDEELVFVLCATQRVLCFTL